MATITVGTTAQTSLTGIVYSAAISPTDFATIQQHILNDQNGHHIWPGAFSRSGRLFVPNRGVLQIIPGDIIAYDPATGWPILLSARAAASNPQWVHS